MYVGQHATQGCRMVLFELCCEAKTQVHHCDPAGLFTTSLFRALRNINIAVPNLLHHALIPALSLSVLIV